MRRAVLLLSLAAAAFAAAPAPKLLPTPVDAEAWALADLKAIPEADRGFVRYLWVPDGDKEIAKSLSDVLNRVSRASVILRPTPLSDGRRLLVVRVDLRHWAPRAGDLNDWLRLWEEFQFDPRFSLLITQDSLKLLADFFAGEEVGEPTVKVKRTKKVRSRSTGQVRTVEVEENVLVTEAAKTQLVRLPGRHLNSGVHDELVSLTGSQAPVVSAPYFTSRALSTIKDKGLFATVYGGLYYELTGLRGKNRGKQTDEDRIFEDFLGIVDREKFFDRLRSDQRSAIFRSEVTGKPRRVDWGHSAAGRHTQGAWSITHDPRDQDIDIGSHPVLNLLTFKDAARELIFDRANGLHAYVLLNGDGQLQDEAPFDVVVDHSIPAPFPRRLQSAISCIRCHEAVHAADGWMDFANDVRVLRRSGLTIFGDTGQKNRTLPDTLDRLTLYDGDPGEWLHRGRSDFDAAVLRATGPWEAAAGNAQVKVIRVAGQKIADVWSDYWYRGVDAQAACRDLGYDVPKEQAVGFLRTLLPPEKSAAQPAGIPEDPRLAALLVGLTIGRVDWDLAYAFAAARAQRSLAAARPGP